MSLVRDFGRHVLLLVERRKTAGSHLFVCLVGQRHAVLGFFLVGVNLVLERAYGPVQVAELVVHHREILLHLGNIVFQNTDGVQFNEQSRQITHDALKNQLAQRQNPMVGHEIQKKKQRSNKNGQSQRVRSRRDQPGKHLDEPVGRRQSRQHHYNFPHGAFRTLPKTLQALHDGRTR